jgi:streptogramin lyase
LSVDQLFPCSDGSFWVLADDRLRKCFARNWTTEAKLYDDDNPDKNTRRKFLASLSSLFVDSNGGIWIAHLQNGVGHVRQDGRVSWVSEPQHLLTGTIHCWYEDQEGNIWIGLFDGGLARLRPRAFHPVWPANGADSRTACSVCEGENGMMWFGTQGQQVLGWDHGAFTRILQSPDPDRVMKVLEGDHGQLWVGSVHGGLLELTNTGFVRPFPAEDISTVVRCFYRDRKGVLWIGSEFGLFAWSKNHLKSFSARDGFSPAYVLALAEDKAGGIWFGTGLGELRCFRKGKFETFLPKDSLVDPAAMTVEAVADSQNQGALSGGERFWSLHFDDDDVLWIGTLGGGLLRFKDGKFTRFTKADGLPSDDVNQILEDSHGQLWLGTSAGIVRVIKRELDNFADGQKIAPNFVNYDKFDGLPALECFGGTQPNCWRSRDGRLWFTTVKGGVWIDPEDLTLNRVAPQTHIEEFLLDGKSQVEKGFPTTQLANRPPEKISIAAGQHFYEFKFSAPSLASPDKVKFKWRLASLDHDWVNGGSHDSANYSFIPPGTYRFEVLGCNNDGVWSRNPAFMEITVLPYYWQRWWFKASIGLFGIAGLITVYSIKVSRLRMLERLRLRIARDLHDEVGANLGSISLLAQSWRKIRQPRMRHKFTTSPHRRSIRCATLYGLLTPPMTI